MSSQGHTTPKTSLSVGLQDRLRRCGRTCGSPATPISSGNKTSPINTLLVNSGTDMKQNDIMISSELDNRVHATCKFIAPPPCKRRCSWPEQSRAEENVARQIRRDCIQRNRSSEPNSSCVSKGDQDDSFQCVDGLSSNLCHKQEESPISVDSKSENNRIAQKEETVRKLKMVKMYRSKNDLSELKRLTEKWQDVIQLALPELKSLLPDPQPTLLELANHLGLSDDLLGPDITSTD